MAIGGYGLRRIENVTGKALKYNLINLINGSHIVKHAELIKKKSVDLKATFNSNYLKIWFGENTLLILKKVEKEKWRETRIRK